MATKQKTVELSFSLDKETKNTVRFAEQVDDGKEAVVGMLYIKKKKYEELGKPEDLDITIRPGE